MPSVGEVDHRRGRDNWRPVGDIPDNLGAINASSTPGWQSTKRNTNGIDAMLELRPGSGMAQTSPRWPPSCQPRERLPRSFSGAHCGTGGHEYRTPEVGGSRTDNFVSQANPTARPSSAGTRASGRRRRRLPETILSFIAAQEGQAVPHGSVSVGVGLALATPSAPSLSAVATRVC